MRKKKRIKVPVAILRTQKKIKVREKKLKKLVITWHDLKTKKLVIKPIDKKVYYVAVNQGKKRTYFKTPQIFSTGLNTLLQKKVSHKFYTLHENKNGQFLLRKSSSSHVAKYSLNKFYSRVASLQDFTHTFEMSDNKSGYYEILLSGPTLISSLQTVALKLSRRVRNAMRKDSPGILFYNFFFTLKINGRSIQLPGPSKTLDLKYDPDWVRKDSTDVEISTYKNPILRAISPMANKTYYNFADSVARLAWLRNEIAYSMRVALKSIGYRFTSLATLDSFAEEDISQNAKDALYYIGINETPVTSLKQIPEGSLKATLWFEFFD